MRAEFVCREALKRTPRNEHSVNMAPAVVASVRSMSVNATLLCAMAPSCRPYQSSPVIFESVDGVGTPRV